VGGQAAQLVVDQGQQLAGRHRRPFFLLHRHAFIRFGADHGTFQKGLSRPHTQPCGSFTNTPTATLTDCTLSDDVAGGNFGGGLFNQFGTATLSRCPLSDDVAFQIFGGGIFSSTGLATLINCTLSNDADAGTGAFSGGAASTFSPARRPC
jgi:hypothetical protein